MSEQYPDKEIICILKNVKVNDNLFIMRGLSFTLKTPSPLHIALQRVYIEILVCEDRIIVAFSGKMRNLKFHTIYYSVNIVSDNGD